MNTSFDLKFFPHAPTQKGLVNRVSCILYFIMITLLLVKFQGDVGKSKGQSC